MDEQSYFEIIDDVMDTWDEIKKIPDYEGVAGSLLFQKIFKMAPSAMNMFHCAEGFAPGSAELYESSSFLHHARSVVTMLDTALGMLGPDLEPLQKALKILGAKHVGYGVLPAHYPIVGEALLSTLEEALGNNRWNSKVKSDWTLIYGILSSSMLEGASEFIEETVREQEEQRVREANEKKEAEEAHKMATIVAYHEEIVPLPPGVAPPEEVNHVRESWEVIKDIDNYADIFGSFLFRKVFEISPAAMKMFSFAKAYTPDSEELYQSSFFLRHVRGVVSMLNTAVKMLGPDMEPLEKALADLGARHIQYGVLPAHYPIFGDALMYTLKTALGTKWTVEVEHDWIDIYEIISSAMLEGAHRRIEMEDHVRAKTNKNEQTTVKASEEVTPPPPGVDPPTKNNNNADAGETFDQLKKQCHKPKSEFVAHHQKAADIRGTVRQLRLARKRAAKAAAA